jgi:1-deoxy-D-xylulose-5-phosphate reductoisomerase
VDTVSRVLDDADGWRTDPRDVDEVLAAERWARIHAREVLAASAGLGRD